MTARRRPARLVVGRVVRPHGIRGEAVVEAWSDAPDRFAAGSRLGVGDPEGRPRQMTVAASRADRDRVLLRFEGVNDRAAIERLRGALLSIATEEAAPAAPGSFYPHEIEGFAVIDPDGARLGVLARVLAGTANDVWVVDTGEGEVLVPAISDAVVSVDPVSATITVRPLPGLFE